MTDELVLSKFVSLERCVKQIRDYYSQPRELPFAEDYLVQDAITQNIQRACEICIDMANYVVRTRKLGVPHASRDSFYMLAEAKIITLDVASEMTRMIGFRNVLVHQYQNINIEIMITVVEEKLDDLLAYAEYILAEMNEQ